MSTENENKDLTSNGAKRMLYAVNTGIVLPKFKEEVKVGDILVSNTTHPVVVMIHKEKEMLIAKILNDDIWFPLDEFVKWKTSLSIERNVNIY